MIEHHCIQTEKITSLQIEMAQTKLMVSDVKEQVVDLRGDLKRILYGVMSILGLSLGKLLLFYLKLE